MLLVLYLALWRPVRRLLKPRPTVAVTAADSMVADFTVVADPTVVLQADIRTGNSMVPDSLKADT